MTTHDLSRAAWRRSRRSQQSGNCVEVAAATGPFTSSPSPGASEGKVAVRDSKAPDGPKLIFTAAQWTAFAASVKAEAFELYAA